MEYIEAAPKLLFTEECIEQYFTNFNFQHVGCFKATLSKALGMGIIGGSLMVKVPQVVKIYNNKSSEGINIVSVLLDLFAITAMASYSFTSGFPFSAWGDTLFLGLQTLAIAVLCMHYGGDTAKATSFLVGYLAIIIAVYTGLAPINLLWAFQTLNIPIVLISKLFQVHTNYKNGSTGQLSAVTVFMLFFGSLARIFTSVQETGDVSMILMYLFATTGNSMILGQLLYYWDNGTKKQKKKSNKKTQ